MKRFFRIFLIVLIAAIVLGTFYWLWKKSRPVEVTYEILEATTGTIQNTSVATGKVSPRDEIMIKPQIQGIISELRKEAGDFVTEGEVIFKGKNLLTLLPEERSCEGLFLSFQYPVEIPGVSMVNFMRAALNEHRKHKSLPPLSATDFLKLMREKRAAKKRLFRCR